MNCEKIQLNNHIPEEAVNEQLDYAARVLELNNKDPRFKDNKPKCFIQTLGCQQNEADSERMAGLAVMMGYEITDAPEGASLIFVNTCAIREHAEKRALSLIGQYKHLKDADPSLIIGVGGCMVTQEHRTDKLRHSYPYVSFTFDTGAVYKIPQLVYSAMLGKKRQFIETREFKIAENLPTYRKVSHTAWLSIMNGCNNFCSYCIVPYVRGRERSRTCDAILREAKELIDNGARDITLLGQNVNSYGKDTGDVNFATLLRRICRLDGDFRVRFMTSHPRDASDELIAAMAEEDKIVKHFHLPVQSGSDRILKAMNRHYDSARYLSIIDKLKAAVPDVSITSDIIVGFPGETEDDFRSTLEMIDRVQYDALFSFIYSPRIDTPAAKMADHVPHEVSAERFARMLELANGISLERNKRFVGRTLRVLAEDVSKYDGDHLTGRADTPRPIHFKADKSVIGSFINVKITEAETFSLNGEIIN